MCLIMLALDVVNSLHVYRVSACSILYKGFYHISCVYIYPLGGLSSLPLKVTVMYLIMLALDVVNSLYIYRVSACSP